MSEIRAWYSEGAKRLCRMRKWDGISRKLEVLAMPFYSTDAYNSYFSERTDIQLDKIPYDKIPVYDYHGIGQSIDEKQPIGFVESIEKRPDGYWALVELYEGERQDEFLRVAARCGLYASVGMLRAGMYPEPPPGGVYPEPTEILQAPIVELSLIIPNEERMPANRDAIARLAEERMCQNCSEQGQPGVANINELDALRAELEQMKKERDEMLEQMRQMRRADAMRRFAGMGVPQSVVDELMDIYDVMPEGSQDKVFEVIGRLLDYAGTSQRAAPKSEVRRVATQQIYDQAQFVEQRSANNDVLKSDLEYIKRRMGGKHAHH